MIRKWLASALVLPFFAGASEPGAAQAKTALPGCETSPEVRQILKEKLDGPEFENLTYVERNATTEQVATELIAKYPRELEPYQRLITTAERQQALQPEQLVKLQKKLEQKAKENPDDPLLLYLAATALRGKDTPQSIELDNRAVTLAPDFPWPYAGLTGIYSEGKTLDKDKARTNLEKFWNLCPTSTDRIMRWYLVKDMELQAKVAAAEHAYLATATDPSVLKDYAFLWDLEFRLSAPADYPAVRKQIAADLTRLEKANPKSDAEWAAFLIDGLKRSGAAQGAIKAKEDELLKTYPQSEQALDILETRWDDAHPKPTDEKDVGAWKQWEAVSRAATEKSLHDFPGQYHDLVQFAFFAANDDDSVSESDGLAAMDAYVKDTDEHWGPEPFVYSNAAEFLLDHRWQPARAIELLEQAQNLYAKEDAVDNADDNRSQKDLDDAARNLLYRHNELYGDILLAAVRADKPAAADSIKAAVEGSVPSNPKYISGYWRNRARLAVLEGRKADGLAYYRLALETRLQPPQFEQGKFKDDLGDEALALWKDLGGSETAWAAWSPKSSNPSASADTARWEKPTQPLPDFALADLSGKIWKLADLRGKSILINLWATWCGPCQAELPQLEKLYEQVKGRSDIQILTFDIDEDPGLVGPFLQKKGYTFPVLPAYSYVVNLLNGFAIPQSWLVNGKGAWLWTQVGYGADDNWQKDMLAKLDSMRSGENSSGN